MSDDLARVIAECRQMLADHKSVVLSPAWAEILLAALPHPPLPRDVAELVKRLRAFYSSDTPLPRELQTSDEAICHEAADTIERLSRALAEADAVIAECAVALPAAFRETPLLAWREQARERYAARTKEESKCLE